MKIDADYQEPRDFDMITPK